MKTRYSAMYIAAVIFFIGCDGGSDGGVPATPTATATSTLIPMPTSVPTATGPIPTPTQTILVDVRIPTPTSYGLRLKSATLLETDKYKGELWQYVLDEPVNYIRGNQDQPFVIWSEDRWQDHLVSDGDGDGYYEFQTSVWMGSFNDHNGYNARLVYGGNRSLDSWAFIKDDPSYVGGKIDALNFHLFRNKMWRAQLPMIEPLDPNTFGDTYLHIQVVEDFSGLFLRIWYNASKEWSNPFGDADFAPYCWVDEPGTGNTGMVDLRPVNQQWGVADIPVMWEQTKFSCLAGGDMLFYPDPPAGISEEKFFYPPWHFCVKFREGLPVHCDY